MATASATARFVYEDFEKIGEVYTTEKWLWDLIRQKSTVLSYEIGKSLMLIIEEFVIECVFRNFARDNYRPPTNEFMESYVLLRFDATEQKAARLFIREQVSGKFTYNDRDKIIQTLYYVVLYI